MLEKVIYPDKRLGQVYQLTFFDQAGEKLHIPGMSRWQLSADTDRETQFREQARQFGAFSYSVHLMTPDEVRQQAIEEKGTPLERFIRYVSKTSGLDKIVEDSLAALEELSYGG